MDTTTSPPSLHAPAATSTVTATAAAYPPPPPASQADAAPPSCSAAEAATGAHPSTITTAASATPAAVVATSTGAARGRPRMHGAGRQANRALRTPVTYAHKLAVIDFYEANARDINATVREFYAHLAPAAVASRKRQIYKWVKERAAIEQMCFKQATAGHRRRRDRGTATTLGAQGELELVRWIQSAGQGVPAASVRARALEIAAQHGVPSGAFQATWSWQQGFFRRHQDAIQRF